MIKNPNKTKWIISICSIIQILCFLVGIFSSMNQETEFIAKIHLNITHNFVWCLAGSLTIFLVVFWVNYLTCGIVGTLLFIVPTYVLGIIIKLSLSSNSWLVSIVACLESVTMLSVVLLSIYYKFENDFKKKQLYGRTMFIYIPVIAILFIWALVESIYKFPIPHRACRFTTEILEIWHSRPFKYFR